MGRRRRRRLYNDNTTMLGGGEEEFHDDIDDEEQMMMTSAIINDADADADIRNTTATTTTNNNKCWLPTPRSSSSLILPSPATTSSSLASSSSVALLRRKLHAGFTSLRGSPTELYTVYGLKFLDSYSYFSLSIIFTLFLSDDFGYTDLEAGTMYGVFGMMITVYGLCTGCLVDNLGVAKSLQLGYGVALVGRIGLFLTTSRTVVMFHLYGLLPFGNCLGIPVLMTGIRRYTHVNNRGFAFGIFYVVMNIAALLAGPVVDFFTIVYKGGRSPSATTTATTINDTTRTHDELIVVVPPWSLTSYRAIILSGIVANFVAFLLTFTVREIKVDEPFHGVQEGEEEEQTRPYKDNNDDDDNNNNNNNEDSLRPTATAVAASTSATTVTTLQQTPSLSRDGTVKQAGGIPGRRNIAVFRPKTGTPWTIVGEIFQSSHFRRYLVVIIIMINVRQIFRHLDATWPKYMIREFGPDVPKGTIYAINPILIIVLVPIVSATTSHIDPLVMIHAGSYISAASVFWLVLAPHSINASILFMIFLSVGESVWSPRLNDYTVSVSEEGREGTYMALSSAPLFLAKLPVGILSGILLEKYCPETLQDGQERQSRMMWLIIGLLTTTSPILLTCCWGYVSTTKRQQKNGGNDGRHHNTDEFRGGARYTELQQTTAVTTTTIVTASNVI